MRVYLVRHGEALDGRVASERPLSDSGRRQAARLGKLMAREVEAPVHIWHSEKLRARETAAILAQSGFPHEGVSERSGLGPNDDVLSVAEEIEHEESDVCIVGHLPFVSLLASQMLAAEPTKVGWLFEPCALLCLERAASGRWWVVWFLDPRWAPED